MHDEVTQGGWTTPVLPAATAFTGRIEVKPSSTTPVGNVFSGLLTASSTEPTNISSDTVKFSTTCLAAPKADAVLRLANGSLVGNNIYNLDGTNQSTSLGANLTSIATYIVRVQNDADGVGPMTVTGADGVGPWLVRYFDAASGGNDITALVTGGDGPLPL